MTENTTLTVAKTAAMDTYDAPAVVYELTSEADERLPVRIRESIPDEFEPSDLGFHQSYHADEWWVGDTEIVFEHPIEPGETVITVIGVRTAVASDLDGFLDEPTVEIGAADAEGSQCWGEVSDSLVDVRIGPDAMADPQAATDGGEVPLANGETTRSSETDRTDDSEGTDSIEAAIPSVQEGEKRSETDPAPEPDTEAVVDRFVDELSSESLSESQRQRLREALGVDGLTSMDARIEHCQQRLGDLSAYVDALETFLDEEGSGQQLIGDFRDDVAAVESELTALEGDLDETATGQQELRGRVDDIEDEVASLRSLREDVAAMESELDDATTEIRSEIESLSTTVQQLQEWRRGVTSAFEDLQSAD